MSDRRRSLFILLLVFGLIAASAVVVATKETKLGLDLQGGVQLVYEGQPTPQQPTVDQQALDRALQIMRERVDAFGVAEPELTLIGQEQIEASLPGVEDADRAADQIGGVSSFESRDAALESVPDDRKERAEVLEVPAGILVVRDEKGPVNPDTGAEPPDPDRWWIIQDNPALSGTDIKNPEQNFDQTGGGQPIVTFDFTDKGRKAFQEITRRIAQRGADNTLPGVPAEQASQQFAIVLDDDLVSKPFINFQENPDGIDGSTGAQISGGFTIQSAQDLAKILQIGALPIKLELISRSQVSATLGAQALDQGLTAGLAGFVIVALFLIGFYRVLGLIASAALVIYGLYFYALVELIPVTLTLPGIAGLVLTLGVAADANIVVFERVKEEVRA